MEELVKVLTMVSEVELKDANKIFPMFHSTHEGHSILLEEVEEARVEMDAIEMYIDDAWVLIKANQSAESIMKRIKAKALLLAAESIQCAAMAQKFIDSNLSSSNELKREIRYYSTQRPISLGTFPKPTGNEIVNIVCFNENYCDEKIGREAYGYIIFTKELSQKDIDDYELTRVVV